MELGASQSRDAALIYGGDVDEYHVKAAGPSVCLMRSALDMCGWCVLSEEGAAISSPEYQ